MQITTGSLAVSGIELGERAGRETGSVRKLAVSIASTGMAHPVTVSPRQRLITGRRRLAAHEVLGRREIQVQFISTVPEALGALVAEQKDGRFAKPMSLHEKMGLDRAMRDELEWWPRQTAGPRRAPPSGGYNSLIAQVLELNAKQYAYAREIFQAALGYHEHAGNRTLVAADVQKRARAAAARLRHRAQIIPVFRWYKSGLPEEELLSDRLRTVSAANPEKISSALATVTGITIGLAGADLSEVDFGDEQASAWDNELTAGIKALRAFQKRLQEMI